MGVLEIAERLGVTRFAVDQWRRRESTFPRFPEHRWTVGGRPAWEWEDVATWAFASGRLGVKPEPPGHRMDYDNSWSRRYGPNAASAAYRADVARYKAEYKAALREILKRSGRKGAEGGSEVKRPT